MNFLASNVGAMRITLGPSECLGHLNNVFPPVVHPLDRMDHIR